MPNFDTKPEGMSYAEWLRSKDIGIRVKVSPPPKPSAKVQGLIEEEEYYQKKALERTIES